MRSDRQQIERRLQETEEQFRVAQAAGGIGWFEWDLDDRRVGSRRRRSPSLSELAAGERRAIVRRMGTRHFHRRRAETSGRGGAGAGDRRFLYRIPGTTSGGSGRWIAGKGEVSRDQAGEPRWLTGVFYEITERKRFEARLLALNETLEARVAQVREEARTLEVLNRTGASWRAELSLDRLVQIGDRGGS